MLPFPGIPELVDLATIYQSDLAKIGVNINMLKVDVATWLDQANNRKYKGFNTVLDTFTQISPFTFFTQGKSVNPNDNNSGFKDDTYSSLIEQAGSEPDAAKRKAIYMQLNQIFLDESFMFPVARGAGTLSRDVQHSRHWPQPPRRFHLHGRVDSGMSSEALQHADRRRRQRGRRSGGTPLGGSRSVGRPDRSGPGLHPYRPVAPARARLQPWLPHVRGPRVESHEWQFVGRATARYLEMPVPRGRVIGGSSSINGTVFLRALRQDLDNWAAAGNPDWSFERCLPYLRKLETDHDFADNELHGAAGPIPVSRAAADDWLPPSQAFFEACTDLGHAHCPDLNLPDARGVGPIPTNFHDGLRHSSAIGYLMPIRPRPTSRSCATRSSPACARSARTLVAWKIVSGAGDQREVITADEVILVRRRHRLTASADALGHRTRPTSCARWASTRWWTCRVSVSTCWITRL